MKDKHFGTTAMMLVLLGVAAAVGCLIAGLLGWSRPVESDGWYYLKIAESINSGGGFALKEGFWPGEPTMSRMPGWPAAIAVWLKVLPFVTPDAAVRALGFILNAFSACLLFLLTLRVFNNRLGAFLAGLAFILHPTALYTAYGADSEPLFIFLALLGSWMFVSDSRWKLAASGLAFGLAALVRANYLIAVIALAPGVLVLLRRREWTVRWLVAAGFALLFMIPPTLWMIRNSRVCGDFPVLSTIAGQTFYGGNNQVVANEAKWWGYWVFPDAVPGEVQMRELAKTMSEFGVNEYYMARGCEFIQKNPGSMPGLVAGKLVRAYVPVPWNPNAQTLAASAFRWMLWIGLAAGLFLFWRGASAGYRLLFGCLVGVNVLTVVIFWGCARFALPAEVFFLPFAGLAAVELLTKRRGQDEGDAEKRQDFVIVANLWGAGVDNPTSKHQIALELARRGHRVLWIEGSGMRRPSAGSAADRGRMLEKVRRSFDGARPVARGISVLSPLLIPLPASGLMRAFNSWVLVLLARKWARILGMHNPVLINYAPVYSGVLKRWGGARTVYHCVDRWDSFGAYDSELMAAVDAECCRYADVVVASSKDLFERCRRHNANTYLVQHGVDHAHFARALGDGMTRPADLPQGRIIGFFGLISEWVDQELVRSVAEANPEATVVLIGKADVRVERLAEVKNIRMTGPVPFEQLPGYAAFFDAGLIPFKVNGLTHAVNPIKLREMLAAGCPVVSTAIAEVVNYKETANPAGLHVADDAREFVAITRELLAAGPPADSRRRISTGVAGETWSSKVDQILALIAGDAPGAGQGSGRCG